MLGGGLTMKIAEIMPTSSMILKLKSNIKKQQKKGFSKLS